MARTSKPQDPLDCTMSLGDHLEELRARIILALVGLVVGMIVCTIFGAYLIEFIEIPYVWAMKQVGQSTPLQSLSPADGFVSYMTISMVAGAILASPWIFYHVWQFIAAGLYPHERRYVYLAAPFSAGLFLVGAALFVFCIAPWTLKYLVWFNKAVLKVDSNFTFTNYVSFVATMTLVFGLTFQTPIAIFFLHKVGILSVPLLRRSRKYVLLGAIVVSAAITPGGDMFSLFALSVPMYALFELGVLLCRHSDRKKQKVAVTNAIDSYPKKSE
jgi:sec-independent protein translocase protein TatC